MKTREKPTKEQVKESITQSIEHWERMMEWAKKQQQDKKPSGQQMQSELGENWYGKDCALCQLVNDNCRVCPLGQSAGSCSVISSPWNKVDRAQTYSDWVLAAGEMLKALENIDAEKYINYDKQGYNGYGFDRQGYDKQGFDEDGYDRQGYDRDGYDKQGFDEDGYDRQGFDRQGFDEDGYDRQGFDRQGFDRDGYNRQGEKNMKITEKKAQTKWCPFFRITRDSESLNVSNREDINNEMYFDRTPTCIGSECMVWVWLENGKETEEDIGYCGLTKQK